MQEEQTEGRQIMSIEQMNHVGQMIRGTYQSSNTLDVKSAEKKISQNLQLHSEYFQMLITFIRPDFNADQNFKLASCNIIKNFFYGIASDPSANKIIYVEAVYEFMINTARVPSKNKQILAKGVQFLLNKDQKYQYKGILLQAVAKKFQQIIESPDSWTTQTIQIIQSLGNLSLAYMNSLVEPEELASFFLQILPIIAITSNITLRFCQEMQDKKERFQSINQSFRGVEILFQIIEIAIQRLFEQEDIIPEELGQIKKSEILFNLILENLYRFGNEKSMISNYPKLNHIKQSILQILYIMNMNILGAIPKPILDSVFLTFISESLEKRSRKRQQDDYAQQIICRCMEIIQYQLNARINQNFFIDYKMDILFSILLYSKTTDDQALLIEESPEKFVEIAEEFTEAFTRSPVIKVRAANLLKAFIRCYDEGVKNLMELIIIFITGSLQVSLNQLQVFKKIQEQFSSYDFWGFKSHQKLDIAFMMLSLIAPQVHDRQELYKVAISILLSRLHDFIKINDKIVIARLIRLIGYYPNSIYFAFIRALMEKQEVFKLQAICAFERISKNKEFLKVFPLMGQIFIEIIDFIEVTDSIFQHLVMNNFQILLCKNHNLYEKVINKLTFTFLKGMKNLQTSSKQKLIVSTNYFSKLMKRQKSQEMSLVLENNFLMIEKYCRQNPLLEDSIIDIYEIITDKYMTVDIRILQFVAEFGQENRLNTYSSSTNYFRLLNKVLMKVDNFQFISSMYTTFIHYMYFTQKLCNPEILKDICFAIGFMIISEKNIVVDEKIYLAISQKILAKNSDSIWYIFLFCHMLYRNAQRVRECLIVEDVYYSVMLTIFSFYYKSKLQRKVVVNALQQLLTYQPEIKISQQIVKFCLKVLSQQKKAYAAKPKPTRRKQKNAVQMRRLLQDDYENIRNSERQHEENNRQSFHFLDQQNIHDQKYQEDRHTFVDLKHPFQDIDEFQCFKHKLGMINNTEIVSESDRYQLNQILMNIWKNDQVRQIVRVSHQLF